MAKQSNNKKSKAAEKLGKGKVTPVQVAFIVDRYLADNNYTQTRTTFRSEASDLISRSPVQEAPKSLLSLGAMLDEYVSLKEQKVALDQERYRLEQDKFRVHNLLKGLQDAMNAFNSTSHLVAPPLTSPRFPIIAPNSSHTVTASELPNGSPTGYSALSTPVVLSRSNPNTAGDDPSTMSIPAANHTNRKRKGSMNGSDAPPTLKRNQKNTTARQLNLKDGNSQQTKADSDGQNLGKQMAVESNSNMDASSGPRVEGPGVVKCLFNQQSQSPPTASSGPKTPPLPSSSQTEQLASPLEIHSSETSSKDVNQFTNCTIISTETIQVSPNKHFSYYSRNQQISTFSPVKSNITRPNQRDHVKGRLNFDATDAQSNDETPASDGTLSPESLEDSDLFDLDFPTLEALGNINLSQLLVDFDIDMPEARQLHVDTTSESTLCSPAKQGNVCKESDGVMSQISSTLTEIRSDKDMNLSGVDSVTTLRSVTKRIQILSPAKSQRRLLDQEN